MKRKRLLFLLALLWGAAVAKTNQLAYVSQPLEMNEVDCSNPTGFCPFPPGSTE